MINMKYIDLTHKITNEIKEYPGDPKLVLAILKS